MIFLPAAWERLELAFKLGGYSGLSLPCVLQGLACRGGGWGGGSWGVEYCKNCCGNATVPAGAGGDGSGVAAPAIHCENRCTYVSARPHRCSFLSSSERVDLLLQLPAPASCGRHTEWGAGGEGMHALAGDSSPQPGTGAGFGLVLCCFPETSAKSVAIHCQPRWEDIGRRCFRSSCHTVFLCKKNVKLLYNLFLIWVCCSHLFQPSREL